MAPQDRKDLKGGTEEKEIRGVSWKWRKREAGGPPCPPRQLISDRFKVHADLN